MDEIIDNIKKGDFHQIDKRVLFDIKHDICYEVLKDNYSKTEYEQMKQKKLFENHIIFDEEGRHDDYSKIWWYSIDDNESLWDKIIRTYGVSIMIIDKDKLFESYSYALVYCETAEDYDLLIYTRDAADLRNRVIPGIAQINESIIKSIVEKTIF